MSQFSDKALQVLKTVAPTLALAVGGPFGSIAAAAINTALGTADPKATEAALASATPEQLLAIKNAEQAFLVQMKDLDIKEDQLRFDDTASARSREVAVKDKTPTILAYVITVGFFGILAGILRKGVPTIGGDALLVMLGGLATAWANVVGYFFGSSAGSATKDKTISDIAKQP